MRRSLIIWLLGALTATALLWAGAWFFLDSVMVYERDPATGYYYGAAGHVHRFRGEGWGSTVFAPDGVLHGSVESPQPGSVVLWGDSIVEAFQVDDEAKLPAQLTAALGQSRIRAVAVARSGFSIADYVNLMSHYERLIDPRAHVIVSAGLTDLVPDGSKFTRGPDFRLEKRPRAIGQLSLRPLFERFELQFAWVAIKRVWPSDRFSGGLRNLRFRPGPLARAQRPVVADEVEAMPEPGAWEFMLDRLAEQSTRPLHFLYAPRVPRVEAGRVRMQVPEQAIARRFGALARERGFGFIDLSADFRRFYEQTGRFAIGFHNGIPGRGHWNEDGHRLAAAAVAAQLREELLAVQ